MKALYISGIEIFIFSPAVGNLPYRFIYNFFYVRLYNYNYCFKGHTLEKLKRYHF